MAFIRASKTCYVTFHVVRLQGFPLLVYRLPGAIRRATAHSPRDLATRYYKYPVGLPSDDANMNWIGNDLVTAAVHTTARDLVRLD